MSKITTPHFFVRHQGRFVGIAVADIQYIEALSWMILHHLKLG